MKRYCPYDNETCEEKGCKGCARRISQRDFLLLPIEKRREILSRMVAQNIQDEVANSCEAAGTD